MIRLFFWHHRVYDWGWEVGGLRMGLSKNGAVFAEAPSGGATPGPPIG